MIIGISGKIGSGKDTIAALIFKQLIKQKYKNYGDEFVEYLMPTYNEILENPTEVTSTNLISYKRAFFADNLKDLICKYIINKPRVYLENRALKESMVKELKNTNREIMIKVGDGLRESIHEDIWLNSFWNLQSKNENLVITDVRYPNELNSILNRGGIVIRVESPRQVYIENKSETSLDNYNFKNKIYNDVLLETEKQIVEILRLNNLID